MMTKTAYYMQMAQEAAAQITGSKEQWTAFLTTSARLYKYPFAEQLMIYKQRPEATACAEYDLWNDRMNRYVKRGSKGIALLDMRGEQPKLRYVFDVADTGERKNSRPVQLWKMNAEHEQPIIRALDVAFDVPAGAGSLENHIMEAAERLARDYWEENRRQISDIVADSYLEGYDELNIGASFKRAAAVSIAYSVFTRTVGNADDYFEHEDFLDIFDFNTQAAANVLGTAVSEMYLDKPMKDHTLLQAICRTNRTYDQGKTHGLIVDYIGIFDDVARALDFDENSMRKIITNIEEIKKQLPTLLKKCLGYFLGVDRTIEGWEGLMAAQECLPTNKEKDAFAADYRVLNRAWDALSPDGFLNAYKADYQWLSRVYESVKPTDGRGGLIWASLGAKTIELVHQNLTVGEADEDVEILAMDADLIDEFLEKQKDLKKTTKKIEINLVAKIMNHTKDPKFIKLGEKLETLREKHEQGLVTSIEFLKLLLELAKEAAQAEKEVVPEQEVDKGIAALTELFNGLKNRSTPVIVERIVADIDSIVKIVRFDGWQSTTAGKQEVKKALRSVVWIKYKIKDKDVFDKAYSYIEQYY